jgi:hypothetical protein
LVDIVTRVQAGQKRNRRSIPSRPERFIFFSARHGDRLWGPTSLLFKRHRGTFCQGKKLLANNPSIVENKIMWRFTSTFTTRLLGMIIKAQDKFIAL